MNQEATKLTGKVESVKPLENRIPPQTIQRFLAIEDLTGTVSDALDGFGIVGAIPSSRLRPTIPDARVAGTALTVRNVPAERDPFHNVGKHNSGLGEMEGHNQAQPGDVLVVEGAPGISGLGGISATTGKRQGEVGAVVDGGVRDVKSSRAVDYPIWSLDITPVTGKWRIKTVEINGVVKIQGITVRAGDLVVADETGVCFVPHDLVERVLARCEEIVKGETEKYNLVTSGLPVVDLVNRPYQYSDSPETLHE